MVDLGCVLVMCRFFWWMNCIFWGIVVIIVFVFIIWKFGFKYGYFFLKLDNYIIVLSKVFLFFDI